MRPSKSRPRVLVLAEAANPEWVSVPLVGWSNARALAKVADVHLVTQLRNRDAVLRAGLIEGTDFTAIDSEPLTRPAYKLASLIRGGTDKGWTTVQALASLSYPYFEHLVWRHFGSRIKSGEFDLVHRIIPLTPTAPSSMARRCHLARVPFLLGPLNGGLPWPKGFRETQRQEKEWLSSVRSLYKLLPGYGSTRRHAAAIIAGSINTWDQMPSRYHERCVYIPENAIDPDRFPRRRNRRASSPVRAVFVGRLVPYKGADMLLEAAAPIIRSGQLQLEIIGDGPQMPDLRDIIGRERIDSGVTLRGWVEHTRIADHLIDSDLLTFPSIREFGGGVVLEAMAIGLVPVVVAYGGPGELVTDDTGYRIPLGSRAQIVEQLRRELESIAADPTQIDDKSPAAIRRVERLFTWDAKASQILRVYQWVLGQSPQKPDFPRPFQDDLGLDDHSRDPMYVMQSG